MRVVLRCLVLVPLAVAVVACGGTPGPTRAAGLHPSHLDQLHYMDVLQRTHSPLVTDDSRTKAVAVGKDVCARISRSGYTHTFEHLKTTWRQKDPQVTDKDVYALIEAAVNHLCAQYKDKLPADGANPFPA